MALGLSLAYLGTQVVWSHAAEQNFWEQRRRTARKQKDTPISSSLSLQNPLQLAQLPQAARLSLPAPQTLFATEALPVPESFAPSLPDPVKEIARQLAGHGTLRDHYLSPKKNSPLIIQIQDAHGVEEAQKNIAAMIQKLALIGNSAKGEKTDRSFPLLVGVEGAAGGFRLEPYRQGTDPSLVQALAGYFLKEGYLGGPEYAGLASPAPLTLWGIEDLRLYEANVQALKEGLQKKEEVENQLRAIKDRAEQIKERIYTPELKAHDRHAAAFHNQKETLGDYVHSLATLAPASQGRYPQLELFLDALADEQHLDFKKVEEERTTLVQALTQRLTAPELRHLVQQSQRYGAGSMGCSAYHQELKALCRRKKIDLKDYGFLDRYMGYVEKAEKIRRVPLLNELIARETDVSQKLARTPEQKELVRIQRNLKLLDKLLHHQLTPEEWKSYQNQRDKIFSTAQSLQRLDSRLSSDSIDPSRLKPFENFCRLALERNRALVENLLKKAAEGQKADGKNTDEPAASSPMAVLVAGGFHTEGLIEHLKAKGCSYLVVTPRITKIPSDPNYLDLFRRDPLPLEKLFSGETISLAYALLLADVAPAFAEARAQEFRACLLRLMQGERVILGKVAVQALTETAPEQDILAYFHKHYQDVEIKANGGLRLVVGRNPRPKRLIEPGPAWGTVTAFLLNAAWYGWLAFNIFGAKPAAQAAAFSVASAIPFPSVFLIDSPQKALAALLISSAVSIGMAYFPGRTDARLKNKSPSLWGYDAPVVWKGRGRSIDAWDLIIKEKDLSQSDIEDLISQLSAPFKDRLAPPDFPPQEKYTRKDAVAALKLNRARNIQPHVLNHFDKDQDGFYSPEEFKRVLGFMTVMEMESLLVGGDPASNFRDRKIAPILEDPRRRPAGAERLLVSHHKGRRKYTWVLPREWVNKIALSFSLSLPIDLAVNRLHAAFPGIPPSDIRTLIEFPVSQAFARGKETLISSRWAGEYLEPAVHINDFYSVVRALRNGEVNWDQLKGVRHKIEEESDRMLKDIRYGERAAGTAFPGLKEKKADYKRWLKSAWGKDAEQYDFLAENIVSRLPYLRNSHNPSFRESRDVVQRMGEKLLAQISLIPGKRKELIKALHVLSAEDLKEMYEKLEEKGARKTLLYDALKKTDPKKDFWESFRLYEKGLQYAMEAEEVKEIKSEDLVLWKVQAIVLQVVQSFSGVFPRDEDFKKALLLKIRQDKLWLRTNRKKELTGAPAGSKGEFPGPFEFLKAKLAVLQANYDMARTGQLSRFFQDSKETVVGQKFIAQWAAPRLQRFLSDLRDSPYDEQSRARLLGAMAVYMELQWASWAMEEALNSVRIRQDGDPLKKHLQLQKEVYLSISGSADLSFKDEDPFKEYKGQFLAKWTGPLRTLWKKSGAPELSEVFPRVKGKPASWETVLEEILPEGVRRFISEPEVQPSLRFRSAKKAPSKKSLAALLFVFSAGLLSHGLLGASPSQAATLAESAARALPFGGNGAWALPGLWAEALEQGIGSLLLAGIVFLSVRKILTSAKWVWRKSWRRARRWILSRPIPSFFFFLWGDGRRPGSLETISDLIKFKTVEFGSSPHSENQKREYRQAFNAFAHHARLWMLGEMSRREISLGNPSSDGKLNNKTMLEFIQAMDSESRAMMFLALANYEAETEFEGKKIRSLIVHNRVSDYLRNVISALPEEDPRRPLLLQVVLYEEAQASFKNTDSFQALKNWFLSFYEENDPDRKDMASALDKTQADIEAVDILPDPSDSNKFPLEHLIRRLTRDMSAMKRPEAKEVLEALSRGKELFPDEEFFDREVLQLTPHIDISQSHFRTARILDLLIEQRQADADSSWDAGVIRLLLLAAFLKDVSKTQEGISLLVEKPGPLNQEEKEILNSHGQSSLQLLEMNLTFDALGNAGLLGIDKEFRSFGEDILKALVAYHADLAGFRNNADWRADPAGGTVWGLLSFLHLADALDAFYDRSLPHLYKTAKPNTMPLEAALAQLRQPGEGHVPPDETALNVLEKVMGHSERRTKLEKILHETDSYHELYQWLEEARRIRHSSSDVPLKNEGGFRWRRFLLLLFPLAMTGIWPAPPGALAATSEALTRAAASGAAMAQGEYAFLLPGLWLVAVLSLTSAVGMAFIPRNGGFTAMKPASGFWQRINEDQWEELLVNRGIPLEWLQKAKWVRKAGKDEGKNPLTLQVLYYKDFKKRYIPLAVFRQDESGMGLNLLDVEEMEKYEELLAPSSRYAFLMSVTAAAANLETFLHDVLDRVRDVAGREEKEKWMGEKVLRRLEEIQNTLSNTFQLPLLLEKGISFFEKSAKFRALVRPWEGNAPLLFVIEEALKNARAESFQPVMHVLISTQWEEKRYFLLRRRKGGNAQPAPWEFPSVEVQGNERPTKGILQAVRQIGYQKKLDDLQFLGTVGVYPSDQKGYYSIKACLVFLPEEEFLINNSEAYEFKWHPMEGLKEIQKSAQETEGLKKSKKKISQKMKVAAKLQEAPRVQETTKVVLDFLCRPGYSIPEPRPISVRKRRALSMIVPILAVFLLAGAPDPVALVLVPLYLYKKRRGSPGEGVKQRPPSVPTSNPLAQVLSEKPVRSFSLVDLDYGRLMEEGLAAKAEEARKKLKARFQAPETAGFLADLSKPMDNQDVVEKILLRLPRLHQANLVLAELIGPAFEALGMPLPPGLSVKEKKNLDFQFIFKLILSQGPEAGVWLKEAAEKYNKAAGFDSGQRLMAAGESTGLWGVEIPQALLEGTPWEKMNPQERGAVNKLRQLAGQTQDTPVPLLLPKGALRDGEAILRLLKTYDPQASERLKTRVLVVEKGMIETENGLSRKKLQKLLGVGRELTFFVLDGKEWNAEPDSLLNLLLMVAEDEVYDINRKLPKEVEELVFFRIMA